jgi:NitT/TauT family transport system permease protein
VASPLLLLGIWEVSGRAGWLDVRFFPLPTRIFTYLIWLFREDNLILDILSSLRRIGLGLAVGFLPGVLIGLAMGLSSWARAALGPLVALTYPIPKIAILPLLLIIFGLGETSNVMVVAIGVFFLALINTYGGVSQIPQIHFDVAHVYRVPPLRRLTHIVLPASFPGIFTGLKLAVGYGLILIVAAEMVAAGSGIGYRIWTSWETYVIIELYACLGVISGIGVLLSVCLEGLERVLAHWKGA